METPTKCPECASEMKATSATENVTDKGVTFEVPNVSAASLRGVWRGDHHWRGERATERRLQGTSRAR